MARSSVEGHDVFFSRIISMISTDLYKHSSTSDALDEDGSKYYKHKKVALGADEKKIASSKKRQLKYSASHEGSETEAMEEVDNGGEDEPSNVISDIEATTCIDEKDTIAENNDNSSSSSLDDLRLRLQRRILGLKSERSSTKEREPSHNDKSTAARKKARNDHVKRKPTKPDDFAETKMDIQENYSESVNGDSRSSHSNIDSAPIEDFGDVQFSLINAKKTSEDKNSSLSKPGTKMKRLKRMLETADKKRQRLDELKSAGSAGANRLKQEQWTDVLKSATGEKTLNDTTKLRKAIKKREKKKETSAREWKGRLDTVESEKTARIAKREENINVKKLGKAPSTPAGEEKAGEKVGAGSGRPRLGFPKPGSQSEEGGKTSIRSATGAGGDKNKGKGVGASGKSGSKSPGSKRAGFEGKTNAGFLNKNGGGGGGGGGKNSGGGGGKRK